MVRKMIACALVLSSLFTFAVVGSAKTYTPYADGGISSSAVSFAKDLIHHVSPGDTYFFVRTGRYEYALVYGDLKYDGFGFSGAKATEVSINSYDGYSARSTSVTDVSFKPGVSAAYSNVGDFPDMRSELYYVIVALLFALVVWFVCWTLRAILNSGK